jgi:DNA repair protein RadD
MGKDLPPPPEVVYIDDAHYSRHQKAGKTALMRVDYYKGVQLVATDWVCLMHEGFARKKAVQWWMKWMPEDAGMPEDLDDAIELARAKAFIPEYLFLEVDGKYHKIVSHGAPQKREVIEQPVPEMATAIDDDDEWFDDIPF